MGSLLNDYISKGYSIADFENELKKLIEKYKKITGRDFFIYAVDFVKGGDPNINISLR